MNTFGIDRGVWDELRLMPIASPPGRVALAAAQCSAMLPDEDAESWDDRRGHLIRAPFSSLADTERSDEAIECHGNNARVAIRNALSEWSIAQQRAGRVLKSLSEWDSRLGAWCACAVAETVLPYAVPGDELLRKTIDATRGWIAGRLPMARVYRLAEAIEFRRSFDREEASAAVASAAYSAVSEDTGFSRSTYAEAVAVSASNIVAEKAAAHMWLRAKNQELARLCTVISGAIHEFPADIEGGSSGALGRSKPLLAGLVGAVLGAGAMHITRKL